MLAALLLALLLWPPAARRSGVLGWVGLLLVVLEKVALASGFLMALQLALHSNFPQAALAVLRAQG